MEAETTTVKSAGALPPTQEDISYRLLLAGISFSISMATVLTNIVNIVVFFNMKHTRKSTKILYYSLTLSDLGSGIVTLVFFVRPAYNGYWDWGQGSCEASGYLTTIAQSVSIYSMAVLSIERALIIRRPFDHHRFTGPRIAGLSCTVVWLVALALPAWSFRASDRRNLYGFNHGSLLCRATYRDSGLSLALLCIMVIGISGPIIAIAWIIIFISARQHQNRLRRMTRVFSGRTKDQQPNRSSSSTTESSPSVSITSPEAASTIINNNVPNSNAKPSLTSSQRERGSEVGRNMSRKFSRRLNTVWTHVQTAGRGWRPVGKRFRTIFAITVGFYVSWLPYIIRQIQLYSNPADQPSIIPDFGIDYLVLSNGFWNSLIYVMTDRDYRQTLLKIYQKLRTKLKEGIMTPVISSCGRFCLRNDANNNTQSETTQSVRSTSANVPRQRQQLHESMVNKEPFDYNDVRNTPL